MLAKLFKPECKPKPDVAIQPQKTDVILSVAKDLLFSLRRRFIRHHSMQPGSAQNESP
jgi:hypothetical protein